MIRHINSDVAQNGKITPNLTESVLIWHKIEASVLAYIAK